VTPESRPDGNPNRPPPGTELCRLDEMASGAIRRFRWGPYESGFRALIINTPAGIKGYVDWCPHQGLPLQDERDDIFIDEGLIVCAWHWARFRPEDGKGCDGYTFEGLHPWPVEVGADGIIRTS
jgi:nitrite reductase/ring-hydroxylating ferredoxin subunit